MSIPPSEHIVWKLFGAFGLGVLYIIGAHIYHKNGWSHNDFKGLAQQMGGAFLFMSGPGLIERAFGRKTSS